MKKLSREMIKKFFIGTLFFLVSMFPLRDLLLNLSFQNSTVDFFFVLFAIAFPHILRGIGIAVISSVIFFGIKSLIMPKSAIEKSLYKLKKKKIIKSLFYASTIILPFIFPIQVGPIISEIVFNLFNILPYYLQPLSLIFLPISFMNITLFLESFIVSCFLLHIIKIISIKFGTLNFTTKNRVIEGGKKSEFKIEAHSKIPLFCFPIIPFKMNSKINSSSMFKTNYEITASKKFPVGYYRFDMLKFKIATFPFFFSTVFSQTNNPAELTVLPKIKIKNVLYNKNPFVQRDTGELVKKVSGSSLEFSGIKEFLPGDPVSKIWWKSLAKGGKLLKKDFFSLAEDRWILIVDLSNPQILKSEQEALLKFTRAFIETFTRKDIEIGIHIISPNPTSIKFSTNKKSLMSFLIKHWSDFKHLSYKGADAIIKDAVGNSNEIKLRCKSSGLSLSSFLFYSGLIKKPKKTFYWARKRVYKKSLKEFMTHLKKSGKILVVTSGMGEDMVTDIQKIARIKKCPLLFTSFQKIPKAKTFILPKERPEKLVWRLMYV